MARRRVGSLYDSRLRAKVTALLQAVGSEEFAGKARRIPAILPNSFHRAGVAYGDVLFGVAIKESQSGRGRGVSGTRVPSAAGPRTKSLRRAIRPHDASFENRLDETIEQSFPAGAPSIFTVTSGVGAAGRRRNRKLHGD
jgi:hypothetical protein